LKENDAVEKLSSIKKLLEATKVDVSSLEKRLQQCSCLGKKIYCMMSAVALHCSMFLTGMEVESAQDSQSHTVTELVYSVKEKQCLSQILEFIVCYGLISNLAIQISILIPKSHLDCKLAKQDFVDISR